MRASSRTSTLEADFGGHRAGAIRQKRRGHDVGRFVDQLAREILRLAQDLAALEGGAGRIGRDQNKRLERFRVAGGFVAIGLEVAENRAFDGGFCICRPRAKPGELLYAFLLECAHGRSDGAAQDGGIEFVSLSSADDREALGLESLGLVLNREFAGLAGEFAGGAQFVRSMRTNSLTRRARFLLQTKAQRPRQLRRGRGIEIREWSPLLELTTELYFLALESSS